MARIAQSRNLKGFGWLTKSRVTYRRDVAKERRELKRQAIEERKERIALKELEAKERAADAKIAAAERKIETAGKKADTGGMSEAKFEAMKARMEKEIEKQEEFKAAARARAGNPCARTRKAHVSDRAKRYRANQPGCKPRGVKKCKLCGKTSDLMVDHIDGNESNGTKRNLRWLCRSCNTLRGAEMAKAGQGVRTVQYNPTKYKGPGKARYKETRKVTGGAQTLGEYINAVLQHTRGAHDEGGRIIHATPKWKRQEYASEIWSHRQRHGNPAVSAEQYRLAQAVLSGTARQTHMSPEAAREIVDRTPAKLRSEYSRSNPNYEKLDSPEYQLGYSLGQRDRETASLPRTWNELESTFTAKFDPSRANALWFFDAYQHGYGVTGGTAGRNLRGMASRGSSNTAQESNPGEITLGRRKLKASWLPGRWMLTQDGYYETQEGRSVRLKAGQITSKVARDEYGRAWGLFGGHVVNVSGNITQQGARQNPESTEGEDEKEQARKIAELFHGRPVKEEITVTESIREHDWLWRIGPLIKLKVKMVTKQRATFPFSLKGDALVHLMCSPDGRQMLLRGGDQELDLDALGMGDGTRWYRDRMVIGQVTEITYRDSKRFTKFVPTDYYHALGEETKVKPWLVYDTLNKKLEIMGGQYHVETEELVESMSPGLIN